MTATPDGHGYWFTAADGGVFAFGDAPFYGSLGDRAPDPARSWPSTADADGGGYWFTNNNGAVTAFGDATYWGSAPQVLNRPGGGHGRGPGTGQLHRLVLPVGEPRLRHLQLPVPANDSPRPPHHRHRPGGGRSTGHQPVPGPGGGVGRRRAQPLHLHDLRRADQPRRSGLQHGDASGGLQLRVQRRPRRLRQGRQAAGRQHLGGVVARRRGRPTRGRRITGAPTPQRGPGRHRRAPLRGAQQRRHLRQPRHVDRHRRQLHPAVPYWAADWGTRPGRPPAPNVQSLYAAALPTGPVQIVQYSSPTASPRSSAA